MNIDVATTRLLRILLIGGTIVLAMSVAADVFKPLALAILITFLLAPIVSRLERMGLPRVFSVAIVLLVGMAAVGATAYIVGGQFASIARDVPKYTENIQAKVSRLRPGEESTIAKIVNAVTRLSKSNAAEEERAQPVRIISGSDFWENLHAFLGPFESALAMGGIVLLLVVFILFERDEIRAKLIQLVGWGRIGVTTKTLSQIGENLSSYLAALAMVNAGFGLVIGLGCWAIGLPSPALWGFLAALCRFIPYLGTLLSFSFPFLISIAHFAGWTQPALVLALFAGAELAVNSVEPLVYGKSTGISPIGLLISALFWAWLWGPLGLLLANALTVCLAVAGRSIPGLEALGILLRHDVSVSDDLRWYQRVLSHDVDGAMTILDDALKTKSLEEVCDQIVIPTLSRAEQDRTHEHVDGRDVAFIWRTVRDWIDEVSERDDVILTPKVADAAEPLPTPVLAGESPALVGIASGGGADALVLRMLNVLLQPTGVRLTIMSASGSSLRVTDRVGELDPALILISHVPPEGLTRARYLVKRMHARRPETPITVGYWDYDVPPLELTERFRPARLVVSLAAARALILERISAVQGAPSGPSGDAAPALVDASRP
ncbi:AI-2E family transporter [Paludisphaera rhizosphaerae]|uniref:AI-2E family transporter n=1 Tax=Paludisphaera rhizosphaerae TaxID=2711216 RepID=UPI0013EDFA6A|nr:AI-2E family transporter [Paludisphaera rhizosphaerae]